MGTTFLVSPDSGQAQQPAQYAPPVHIQPTAWSVLESEQNVAEERVTTPAEYDAARSKQIANMSQYMRRQNESVTSAQDAQVNAALYSLQASRTMAAQGQRQSAQPAAFEYRNTAPQRQTQQRQVQQRQPAAFRPVAAPPMNTAQRRPTQTTPLQRQPQTRKPVGLQDRISHALKSRFTRPATQQVAQGNVGQQIPVQASPVPMRRAPKQIELVDHTVEASSVAAELELPMLADEPVNPPRLQRQQPKRAPKIEYRPKRNLAVSDDVIVPSFVEADTDELPELRLASSQDAIGSGVRRPRVSSHSTPTGYGRTARQEEISVFRNASSKRAPQDDQQDRADAQRLRELDQELNANKPSRSDSELPQRTTQDDGPSLLDLDDEDSADEARRARSSRDAEVDDLEDEQNADEGDGPPVFDERGCDELRSLLLKKTIRDISLDISPPASSRRTEMGTITRTWTDPSGYVLASGTMVDLRRGYVILDSGQKLPYAKLSEADWSAIAENWLLPSVCSVGQYGSTERNWMPQTVTWHASSLCHKPLYFENIQLERYGHSRGPFMQPIHSTFHFFGSILFLPYKTAINPPNECQYSLGFYRPGNCAPWLIDPIPFSRDGIRRQTLVALGLGLIP